ncbi:DEKNAAC101315 [Brettanomyces naardenensis]|uniref:DEKNAAC101315 n=1 Tax=Brettanomyces naardenensis TaxID=13370 RepID=A0A448YHK8_BRENA|nr:DEKNAAC101315 [Brettanomyces naardenensis]
MVLIAAGQLCASSCLKENGLVAARLIVKASQMGCKVLFLPEASDYIAKSAKASIELAQPVEKSPFLVEVVNQLKELNRLDKSIYVAVGVHEPAFESKRVKNTLLYLDKSGKILQRYQKIHLFDVDIKEGPILKESRAVEPGTEIVAPFETPAGLLGLGICYDLRFPELALRLRTLGAQILTFPAAWTVKTGPHFELLGKATAVLTQSYVVLPSQKGKHRTQTDEDIVRDGLQLTRESFGHTCIIDPNGTIISQCSDISEEESICVADINLDNLNIVRNNMPLWKQRRSDVFGYKV